MQRVFFYNSATGAAAIGDASPHAFTTSHSFPVGAFTTGWTHVAEMLGSGGRLLFYDAVARSGALAQLTFDSFLTRKAYPPGSFGSWTHLLGTLIGGHTSSLFYNAASGEGAIGFDPTLKNFPAGAFSGGWTHVVSGRRSWRVLFYNAVTGAGALDFDPSTALWPPGAFSTGWTHVAVGPPRAGRDAVLFYDATTRSAALGLLGADGFTTVNSWEPGSFSEWSLVIGTDGGFLFYNTSNGAAAHDVLHSRSAPGGPWALRVSAYPKLRLAPEWMAARLGEMGLRVVEQGVDSGQVVLAARTRHRPSPEGAAGAGDGAAVTVHGLTTSAPPNIPTEQGERTADHRCRKTRPRRIGRGRVSV